MTTIDTSGPGAPAIHPAPSRPGPRTRIDAGAQVRGVPAGFVSRSLVYILDLGITLGLYAAGAIMLALGIALFTLQRPQVLGLSGLTTSFAYFAWALTYAAVTVAIWGATPGMGLLGLRIIRVDGRRVRWGRATLRAFLVPVLFAVTVFVDMLWILFDRRRRAIHDHVLGTIVIYDWSAHRSRAPD